MSVLINPYRGVGLPSLWEGEAVLPSVDALAVSRLLMQCPAAGETPLREMAALAAQAGVGAVFIKDECARMGLGSFKALGAAYVIARAAQEPGADIADHVYIAASAGNHGLSVAAGAKAFGARAVIVLAETVPEGFAQRLRDKGAEVIRAGAIYEDSMAEAMRLADVNGWTLLSDSSWPGYTDLPYRVMEGYLQMAAEAVEQIGEAPSHVVLQAGVGGLAAAVAAYVRKAWGDDPRVIVVEPDAAPALIESIRAGALIATDGPVSTMGRLDCKEPSLIALAGLARDADVFMTISDVAADQAVAVLATQGIATTPSGAAGVGGLLSGLAALRLTPDSRVLIIVSEVA
jgi:diaminopropionate ammonia-lyase